MKTTIAELTAKLYAAGYYLVTPTCAVAGKDDETGATRDVYSIATKEWTGVRVDFLAKDTGGHVAGVYAYENYGGAYHSEYAISARHALIVLFATGMVEHA